MSLAAGVEVLSSLGLDQAVALAGELPLGSAVSLLRRLDSIRRADIVKALPENRKHQIRRQLECAENTVGAAADPEVFAIPDDLTCGEALRLLRRQMGKLHHQLYVVDRGGRLLGCVHMRDLLRAAPKEAVTSAMRAATVRFQADARLASSIHHPGWRDLDAIPVIDDTGVLVGILRHRQLRQLRVRQPASGISSTLIGFSELFWIGLSALLPTAQGHQTADNNARRRHAGGKHGK
jgi:magnesium transporter